MFGLIKGLALLVLLGWPTAGAGGQKEANPPATDSGTALNHALELAERGQCREALPVLRKSLGGLKDKDRKFEAGMAVARCGMGLNELGAALEGVAFLNREFPREPRVLYVTTHYLSELANRASEELAATAPGSKEAMELDAEAYESQGRWDEAVKEYRMILQKDSKTPAIHYRLGRILLSKPPTPTSADQARKEFAAELELHPDAPSEFMLGDLARQAQQWDEAIEHFSRAAEIDEGFSEAYLGLGIALNASQKYSGAVAPLEKYVEMEPSDPAGHYQLAISYGHAGRPEDAARQITLQHDAEKAQGQRRPEPR